MFPKCWDFVSKFAPVFPARSDQIRLLSQPSEFYLELIQRIQNAQSRVILTSLYMGTGPLEEKLVNTLKNTLTDNEKVNVRILLDANRGTRGPVNSRTLLSPIVKQFSRSCQVSFYHTPDLRWPLNKLLPHRYNELVGLQHMKFYLIDDSVIITGANLSSDYFTNRQDRYIVIENHRQLSDFFDHLSLVLSRISFQLSSSDNLTLHEEFPHDPTSRRGGYTENSRRLVLDMYDSYRRENILEDQSSSPTSPNSPPVDTWISPLIELPPLGIQRDSCVTQALLSHARDSSCVTLGTGYFNLTQRYVEAILKKPRVHFELLMAHPTANGFLNAKGVAGGIPFAYTILASRFLASVSHLKVSMYEYIKSGWTYHAKGLWYSESTTGKPVLTLIGSSNFGERSLRRDLECSLLLITHSECLHTGLQQEKTSLLSSSVPFTLDDARRPERKPPLWVYAVLTLFRYYF